MISFERTKTNHDNLPRENNTESYNNPSNTFHIICINFQVVFFENISREFGNQGRRIFKKELIHK